jgi:hypothetical protein
MLNNRSNYQREYGSYADEYSLPEPEDDNCTPATWAYLQGHIEAEQAIIIDTDGLPGY